MREQVVEFGAHLEDALWGVVGEEFVSYLVDEALVVRWGDWGGVFDGFAGRCVLVVEEAETGGSKKVLTSERG